METFRSSCRTEGQAAPSRVAEADADDLLVQRSLAGDRTAFEALVNRHHRPIFSYVYRMVGSPDLAADLTQEVFLKVYTALSSYNPAYRFTTWAYRIASNRVIDHLRRRRMVLIPLDPQAAEDGRGQTVREVASDGDSPEEQLMHREAASDLTTALSSLPREYRELIVLRHFHHRSYEEIASIKDSPLGTVKNRLFRAREALRRRLES